MPTAGKKTVQKSVATMESVSVDSVCRKRDNTNEIYSGKFCECDNFNCDRSNGLICGGENGSESGYKMWSCLI